MAGGKDMATSVQVGLANLREGKPLKKKARSRVHLVVGLLALAALAGAGAYVAKRGLPDIDPVKVHRAIDKAGYFGIALYVLGFGLSELLHLPAMVFVVAGVLCWGHVRGWLLALVMAPLSCSLSFLVVRKIGGQVLADVQWSFVAKMMARLEEWPVRTVVTLRLCFFLAPAINYLLALSAVSFRDFFVGTVAGLAVPLSVAVFFIDRLIEYMGWSKGAAEGMGGMTMGDGTGTGDLVGGAAAGGRRGSLRGTLSRRLTRRRTVSRGE